MLLLKFYVPINTYIYIWCFFFSRSRSARIQKTNSSYLPPATDHLMSPAVLLNPMSWPPLRSVLVSKDELSESADDELSDRPASPSKAL